MHLIWTLRGETGRYMLKADFEKKKIKEANKPSFLAQPYFQIEVFDHKKAILIQN